MAGAVKSIFRRPWHLICVLWFVVHIPTTILVDGQSGAFVLTPRGTAAASAARPVARARSPQPPPPPPNNKHP